jgi:thiamine pyrophosphokinase
MSRIVIFANGEIFDIELVRRLVQPADLILCADGGSHHALALGLRPDMIIGDLDSIDNDDRAKIQAAGIPVHEYSHDKDETDLELTIQYAVEHEPSAIVIIGALGRRLDHTIGNIALLSSPSLASVDIRLDDGLEEVFFCRQQATVQGAPGDLVSLIPWGDTVSGVRTSGLKWPLHGETLYADKTRGISNEMLDGTAAVTISSGLLLVIHRREVRLPSSQNERLA